MTEPYDKGVEAGKVLQRLDGHDMHFARINGSLERVGDELHGLKLEVQRLSDQAKADAKTLIITAVALKDADQARRDAEQDKWTPVQKAIAVVGVLAVVAGVVVAVIFGAR